MSEKKLWCARGRLGAHSLVWAATVGGMAGMRRSCRASTPFFCSTEWCVSCLGALSCISRF